LLALLALDGHLARAEPKTLRYRVLHTAARLTSSGRYRHLRIPRSWPWAAQITRAWTRISCRHLRPGHHRIQVIRRTGTTQDGRDRAGGAWMRVRQNRGSRVVDSTHAGLVPRR
jgi:hypothetical protein